jgi:poly(A) polymerase
MDEINATSGQKNEAVILKRTEHIISRRNIDPDALGIMYRLQRLGFIAYLTGGAVRDMMLGKSPKDFDIVTNARPRQIKNHFANVYIIGRRFRLAHIHFQGGKIIEVATFRKNPDRAEQDTPAIKNDPKNIYGTPLEDAFRRDITINALFYDALTGSVIDYTGGLEDLRLRRIRVIGDPGERFREDPVRIWRVIRYAERAGFNIEAASEREIPPHRHLLAQCPGSRLYEEFHKDLLHAQTRSVIEGLRKYGILSCILGRAGSDYETDSALFARLCSLLGSEDHEKLKGFKLMLDEMCVILFWPWLEPLLIGAQGDMHVILKNAFMNARMEVILPKNLRAQVIDILVMVGKMIRALRTGRMRWSMRGRPQFALASRLCFLIEKGRSPETEESFESFFRQAFPQKPTSGSRRRRRCKKRPALQ